MKRVWVTIVIGGDMDPLSGLKELHVCVCVYATLTAPLGLEVWWVADVSCFPNLPELARACCPRPKS